MPPIAFANYARSMDKRSAVWLGVTQNSRKGQEMRVDEVIVGYCFIIGGPCRSRTCDQRIKSPMLYRLS